ncbi:GntR family transcriptional regulator [Actinacidiphila soli]|uniref:GntR family transcriptional regulator n=1 Tax=Actinacidiphila soli TaxID=2487275 RepID=UPI001F0C256E|nr:GntR family transcriptional regulator [Actinacidiphila soli]
MEDLDETRAKWRQVYEVIERRIETGEYPPGSRIPSVVELQSEYGIALATVQKAVRALKEAGLIRTEQGIGSFVAGRKSK